jgi:DNA-binding GntR family transcriptional regulator
MISYCEYWTTVNMKGRMKTDTLRGQVYEALRGQLRTGKLAANRAETERDLAEKLGVSRTPVREALALLVHEGLISSGSRGFVRPELSREDIADLFQIRRMLEPGALVMTIDRLSAHDIRMLRQHLAEHEAADAAGNVPAFIEANASFRAIWIGAIPNAQLRTLIERQNDYIQWIRDTTLSDPTVRTKVIAGLRRILAALVSGKPAAVTAAIMVHLDAAERAFAAALETSSRDQLTG